MHHVSFIKHTWTSCCFWISFRLSFFLLCPFIVSEVSPAAGSADRSRLFGSFVSLFRLFNWLSSYSQTAQKSSLKLLKFKTSKYPPVSKFAGSALRVVAHFQKHTWACKQNSKSATRFNKHRQKQVCIQQQRLIGLCLHRFSMPF